MSVYFLRDKFYRSKGSQLFSEFGELWKLDVASGEQKMVIRPFRGFQIILVGADPKSISLFHWPTVT